MTDLNIKYVNRMVLFDLGIGILLSPHEFREGNLNNKSFTRCVRDKQGFDTIVFACDYKVNLPNEYVFLEKYQGILVPPIGIRAHNPDIDFSRLEKDMIEVKDYGHSARTISDWVSLGKEQKSIFKRLASLLDSNVTQDNTVATLLFLNHGPVWATDFLAGNELALKIPPELRKEVIVKKENLLNAKEIYIQLKTRTTERFIVDLTQRNTVHHKR